MRDAAPSRPISATTARPPCPASRPQGAVAGRSPPQPRSVSRSLRARPQRASGVVGTPLYDGAVPLRLLARAANAGKVELLLDRYLASLDREPVLIVPNR